MEYGSGVLVGERGQITIEKPIRDRLGIRPRDVAVQSIENGRLVVTFVPGSHRRSLLGALGGLRAGVGMAPGAAMTPGAADDAVVARGVTDEEPASAPWRVPERDPEDGGTPR